MASPDQRPAPAPTAGAPVLLACRRVVDDLAARAVAAAAYVLLDGRLRCAASAGIATLTDGAVPPHGPLGRAVAGAATTVGPAPDGVGHVVCVPVLVGDQVAGALLTEHPGRPTDDEVRTAEAAGRALSQELSQAGVPAASVGQRLAQLALDLSSTADRERLHRLVVEGATRLSGSSSAAVVDLSAGGSWSVTAATGPLAQAVSEWGDRELAPLGQLVHDGVSVHLTRPATHDVLDRAGVTALSAYALVVGGQLGGLLVVADEGPRPLDPVASAAVEVLAALAGASLRAAGLVADLAERGRGALDGLPGPDDFRDDLTDFCIDAIRSGEVTHTCLLLGPAEHAADDALGALVEALLGQLRHGDRLYRTDDQEFAVLLATGSPESAAAVTGRLERAAREAGVAVALGWALVDGPPAAVTAATRASLAAHGT